MKEAYMSGQ